MNHFSIHQKLTQHCKSTILQLKKKHKERLINYWRLIEIKKTLQLNAMWNPRLNA